MRKCCLKAKPPDLVLIRLSCYDSAIKRGFCKVGGVVSLNTLRCPGFAAHVGLCSHFGDLPSSRGHRFLGEFYAHSR